MDRRICWCFQLRILFRFGLDEALSLRRIVHYDQHTIVKLIPDFYAYVRISRHIRGPASWRSLRISGSNVKLSIVRDAINCHRVRKQKLTLGLQLDCANLIGERPIGDRSGDQITLEPKAGYSVMRIYALRGYARSACLQTGATRASTRPDA